MQMKWTKDASDPQCTVYKCGPWQIDHWVYRDTDLRDETYLWLKGRRVGNDLRWVDKAKSEAARLTAAFERWFAKGGK